MTTSSSFASPTAIEMIRLLFRFNDWTFPQMVRAISRISDEQYRQSGVMAGGVRDGSIYSTFGHLAYVEEDWLIRWMGQAEDTSIDLAHYATLETIANHRETVKQTRDTWLANLSSEELNRVFRSRTGDDGIARTFPLWPVLFNVPIHTSHHRAEIYEALTRFGVPPQEEPDLIDYVQAHPESIATDSHEADTAQPTGFDLIRLLYDFSDWVGQQLIRAVSRVPDSELRKPGVIAGGAGDGSIQAMFAHVVGAEGHWFSRWTGVTGNDPGDGPPASRWEAAIRDRRSWLESGGANLLGQPLSSSGGDDGVSESMPLWPALIHVPIHTTHHRAEIYAALTSLGFPPEAESHVIFYLVEQLQAVS
ncbi:hypothetical protein BH09CHL1_BH09CHL1_14780 [soil metagenome]